MNEQKSSNFSKKLVCILLRKQNRRLTGVLNDFKTIWLHSGHHVSNRQSTLTQCQVTCRDATIKIPRS